MSVNLKKIGELKCYEIEITTTQKAFIPLIDENEESVLKQAKELFRRNELKEYFEESEETYKVIDAFTACAFIDIEKGEENEKN